MFPFFPYNSDGSDNRYIVAKREGQALAASLGATYAECSSLLNEGVQQAIDTAVELTLTSPRQRSSAIKGFFKSKSKKSNSAKEDELLPPVMPPAGTVKENK